MDGFEGEIPNANIADENEHPWLVLENLIGRAHMWPPYIRDAFFETKFSYKNRLMVATFCYVNNVPWKLCDAVLKYTLGLEYNWQRRKELHTIFHMFEYNAAQMNSDILNKYYSFNVDKGRLVNLAGQDYV